jgi:hypothetical protein
MTQNDLDDGRLVCLIGVAASTNAASSTTAATASEVRCPKRGRPAASEREDEDQERPLPGRDGRLRVLDDEAKEPRPLGEAGSRQAPEERREGERPGGAGAAALSVRRGGRRRRRHAGLIGTSKRTS